MPFFIKYTLDLFSGAQNPLFLPLQMPATQACSGGQTYDNVTTKISNQIFLAIRHLNIYHNVPYLPPKVLHKHCFQFLLGRLQPRGGDTPIHYLYGYVPPNGVVILKLLI